MHREFWAVVAGVGIEAIVLLLQQRLTDTPLALEILGYIVGGLFIVGGSVGLLWPRRERLSKAVSLLPDSTIRTTVLKPRPGWRLRILGYTVSSSDDEPVTGEIYFGTGANYETDSSKQIGKVVLRKEYPNYSLSLPREEQPTGFVDDVVSLRTDRNVGDRISLTLRSRQE